MRAPPSDLAGTPARTETPEGPVEGVFLDFISPHQPFFDMLSISHPAGNGAEATIRFEGDLFEMEDQHNWTDASYKTYSTPLRIPYPVEVDPRPASPKPSPFRLRRPPGCRIGPWTLHSR